MLAELFAVLLVAQGHELTRQPADTAAPDLNSESYWSFVEGPSDDFSTSLNADVWSRSFPSWPGTPPAAIVEDNAAVNASDGTLEITARLDPDFTFPTAEPSCSCSFETYTTGLVTQRVELAPPANGRLYIEIRAQAAPALVQSNIWLQGPSAEISAFEITGRSIDGSPAETCETALHVYDLNSTTASQGYSTAGVSTVDFSVFGILIDTTGSGSVTTTVNGGGATAMSWFDGHDLASAGLALVMDVSINETVGLPADTDLPAVFKIDHIRVFEEALVEGYAFTPTARACSAQESKRASIRGLPQTGHSVGDCKAGCDNVFDCYHFTVSRTGRCYFFEECDVLADSTTTKRFDRLSSPEPPTLSILEGYNIVAEDEVCDVDEPGSTYAIRQSIGNSGHRLEQCVQACNRQITCMFMFYSDSGYCKMFETCNTTKSSNPATIYQREQFQMASQEIRCDKDVHRAEYRSLGGRGHSLGACSQGCDDWSGCAHFVWFEAKGFCHLFSGYCDNVTEAKGGSQFFHRVGDARVPELLEFELLQTAATCNKHTSVEADLRRLERGANFQECSRACAEQESCLVFQFSRTGFCKMWRECNDITSKPNVLIYGRTEAATSITATVTTATGITQTSLTATSITQADDTAAEAGALQGRSRDAEHTDAVVSGNMTSSSVGTWIVLAAALVGAAAWSGRNRIVGKSSTRAEDGALETGADDDGETAGEKSSLLGSAQHTTYG